MRGTRQTKQPWRQGEVTYPVTSLHASGDTNSNGYKSGIGERAKAQATERGNGKS
jgi:hypothetical protein